ncbi:MAG TPA: hypothetical protein VES91_07055 [Burkholderiaceae bacterium]|nr:hypothetical protein [Burkholderiaceae bacterium]
MPAGPRLLAAALRDSPHAASLLARWEATQRAALAIAPACRSIAGFDPLEPGMCELRGEILWLSLPSPSASAKLRQATPRLLSNLAADGIKVYEIKTRVQPAVTSYPGDGSLGPSSNSSHGIAWPPNDERAAAAVAALAGSLGQSPLKEAAQKLAATLRERLKQP